MGNWQEYATQFMDNVILFLTKVFGAIIVLFIGFWLVKKIEKLAEKALEKVNFDGAIVSFL